MHMRNTRGRLILRRFMGVCGVVVSALGVPAEGRSPNVVMIMADDLGYGDLGCYGHPKIKTSVLDKLAKDGIRLTSFYSGSTVCTPSRMALLTGAYAWRTGWTKGVVGYGIPEGEGMSPDALTIAKRLTEIRDRVILFVKQGTVIAPDRR